MNRRTMERIDAALDGSLDAAEFAALQDELREDPAALEHWCKQSEIHGRLQWELAAESAPFAIPVPKQPAKQRRFIPQWAAAAALLLGGIGIGWFAKQERPGSSVAIITPPVAIPYGSETVGRITGSENAQWSGSAHTVGDWIGTGPLDLVSGSAVFTFDCGASVQLRGPARLHLTSPTRALLETGTATVDIPAQAYGFVFETPTTEISRRLSRFALAVDADGHTEVHVLDGEIRLSGKLRDLTTSSLAKDSALRVDQGGAVVTGTRYRAEQLTTALPESADLLPAWYLHWGFDDLDTKTGTFRETGKHRDPGPAFNAQVHLSHPDAQLALVPGRFGNAIRMNGQRGFLATEFPGIEGNQPRSIAFWVKIEPDTPETLAYSFLSWGVKDPEGGGKWQLGWNRGNDNPGVVGAIRTEVELGYHVGSTDLRTGRWHHVVSVFSGGPGADISNQVRHYVDGRLEATTAVLSKVVDTKVSDAKSLPLTIGRRLDVDDYFRTFRGEMDEVYVFPSALTPEQIEHLYRDNKAPELRGE